MCPYIYHTTSLIFPDTVNRERHSSLLRASVGPKCEAFTAPVAFLNNDNFFSGSNDLCAAEAQLIDEYISLGRPDLADCVKTGKPFQWLSYIFASTIGWEAWHFIRALGEAVGVEMPPDVEAFMLDLRSRYTV